MKLTIARFDAVAFRFAVSSIMRSCANKHSERHQRLFSKPLPVPEIPHARFLAGRAREHERDAACAHQGSSTGALGAVGERRAVGLAHMSARAGAPRARRSRPLVGRGVGCAVVDPER